jgi:hypothetical protein
MGTLRGAASYKARAEVILCLKSRPMSPQQLIAHYRITAKLGEGGMGEVHRDLKAALSWAVEHVPEPSVARSSRWPVAAAVLATALVVAAAGWWRATRSFDHPLTRLSVDLGPEALAGLNLTIAISPDGRRLVYPARGPDGKQLLATRLLDQAQATLLPGTESGADPFFAPDGQWIGFFSDTQLERISVQGGAPVILANLGAAAHIGAAWSQDGSIIAGVGILRPLALIPAAAEFRGRNVAFREKEKSNGVYRIDAAGEATRRHDHHFGRWRGITESECNSAEAGGNADENGALTAPLSITGKADELDRELSSQLTSFTESVMKTGSNLDELKTQHAAAVKAVEAENKKKIDDKKKGNGSRTASTPPPTPTPTTEFKDGKPVFGSKTPQAPVETGSLFDNPTSTEPTMTVASALSTPPEPEHAAESASPDAD